MDNIEEFREKLAALCHDQWAHWMSYLFSKCHNEFKEVDEFTGRYAKTEQLIIPKWAVDQWKYQTQTPYSKLSEKEKESNREQADKFLEVINDFLKTECL